LPDILKKYLASAIAVAVCTALTLSVCMYGLTVSAANTGDITVVLDAGHGGIDGGVKGSATGVNESEINLAIVKKTRAYFEKAGINCVLTRQSEAGLYGVLSKGFKKRDMQKRKEIIEGAKPVAVISIHQNFYSSAKQRGGQVFYGGDNENSKLLAAAIQKGLNNLCGGERSILFGDYFMLKCTQYPSVIVECGFLSNADDEALLLSEEYREKLADVVFTGVIEYLSVPSVR